MGSPSKRNFAVLVVGLHEAGRLISDIFIFSPDEAFKEGSEGKLTRPGDISTTGSEFKVELSFRLTEVSDFERCCFLKDNRCLDACSMPSYTSN